MYPRTNYEMTEEDLAALLEACRSTPAMMIGGYASQSPQENANAAWALLGQKMGFDYMTVQPMNGKGQRFFSAIPSETEQARAERLEREAEEKRQQDIAALRVEIADREARLAALTSLKPEAV